MAKDPTDDLPPELRAFERKHFPLAVQRERRRERDGRARVERQRERLAEVWRRDLAAYAMADSFDDDAPAVVHLKAGDAKRRLSARAEAVLVARRKAARDVRAAWFALGEAALAAGTSPRLAGFSGRTVREAAMVAYWRPLLERAAGIGLLPDDAVSPAAMMAWLKPHLTEGWRYNKALRTAADRRRQRGR